VTGKLVVLSERVEKAGVKSATSEMAGPHTKTNRYGGLSGPNEEVTVGEEDPQGV
jgi:hypothetical protein